MQIYFNSASLEEGFEILNREIRTDRLLKGRQVCKPSGWLLFKAMQGQKISCHFCGCTADQWVSAKGKNDKQGHPVLDLFATATDGKIVLMTRDHIIPKSLGGTDDVENLRPACGPCNETRANDVSQDVIDFAKQNPHLVDIDRVRQGLANLRRSRQTLEKLGAKGKEEMDRITKPFQDMGYL